MRTDLVRAVLGVLIVTAGGAILAAPGGQGQDRPGQISQSRVFVENRGRSEALPVVLQEVMTPSPVPVQVAGTPTVNLAPMTIVPARLVRQIWEYRTIDLEKESDPATALSRAGADGWEATGIQLLNRAGAPIVLKRPRP